MLKCSRGAEYDQFIKKPSFKRVILSEVEAWRNEVEESRIRRTGVITSGAKAQAGSPSAETGRMPVLQSTPLLITPPDIADTNLHDFEIPDSFDFEHPIYV